MSDGHDPITLNRGTVASNAGRLDVEYGQYLRCFPEWAIIWGAVLICAAAGSVVTTVLMFFVHWLWGVVALPATGIAFLALVINAFYYYRIREVFRHGDVNPGVVVSTDPHLVAVRADLTNADKPYPMIKVLWQPLAKMVGGPPPIGTRLATVSTYEDAGGAREVGHWSNIKPTVIDCVTTRQEDIQRVMASIPHEEWAALDRDLKRIPQPIRPGLYPV
jgi:hypothetical protein